MAKDSDERQLPSDVEPLTSSETSLPPQKRMALRVLPARLSPPLPEYAGPELLAFVSPETLSRLQIENGLDGSTFLRVVHRKLPSPPDPSSSSKSDRTDPPIEQVVPRVLHPRERVDQTQDTTSTEDVYLGVVDNIMTSHIVFPVPPKGLEDWDIVRYFGQTLSSNSFPCSRPFAASRLQ